jgi:NAD(P)-dependent dehydrogenase (short-subunit alcohol dehydrogenase family)
MVGRLKRLIAMDHAEFGGKSVLITGGSRGIGLATAQAFAESGATIIVAAQKGSPDLDQLISTTRTRFLSVDLSQPDAGDVVSAQAGPIDILINNVGLASARPQGFLEISDAEWQTSFSLNFFACVRVTRALLPAMLEREGACLVNTVSVNAELPDPAVIDYSAAKAAMANFSKSLSKAYGDRVRVNWVNPGPVETDLWLGKGGIADTFGAASGTKPEDVARNAVAGSDTKRFSHPREIAELIVFLASPAAANITGAGFRIDGGLIQTI